MVATPPPPPLTPADPPPAPPVLTAMRSLAVTPFLDGFLQGAFSVFVAHYGQRRAARRAAKAAATSTATAPAVTGDDPLRDGLSAAVVSSAGGGVGGVGGTAAAPAAGVRLVE
ncbi:hypothetical protein MMPV_000695 [Pyropia vietnamensis]